MVKIRWMDRLLLALCGALGALGALGLFALIALRHSFSVRVAGAVISLVDGALTVAALAAIAVLLLLWSIRVLMLAFRREPKDDKASVSVQSTEHGSVRVAVPAIDMLVKRAVSSAEGVVDVKTHVVNHDDSVSVNVDMTLDSDVHIPNVTMLMQRSIKRFIEEHSGIAVREVTILVSKIIEVQPHPPLQIVAPEREVHVIDEADAIEPAPEGPAQDEAPEEPGELIAEPEDGAPDEGAPEEAAPPEEEEPGEGEAAQQDSEPITEKDFW